MASLWLTDLVNWPVNGEIDIVEGAQSVAKTALHSRTKGCSMDDIPLGTMTGEWTRQRVPNAKTGIPDMTVRYTKIVSSK
jgi:hypothetical protein